MTRPTDALADTIYDLTVAYEGCLATNREQTARLVKVTLERDALIAQVAELRAQIAKLTPASPP